MKRNIISSKVEPQNTEDLWLNLVDGNIYSYEYGTWTNVNNVPNRVFNLDIDYTEENLTKFLSPLYEEGFSDDDFPKKVWDKYCETNPEFKLQGERENVRINVSINKSEKLIENLTEYVGDINTPVDFEGEMVTEKDTQYIAWAGSSSHIDVLYVNDLGLALSCSQSTGYYNNYPCIIHDTVNNKTIFTTDVPNISRENNKFPVSLLKELGIIGSRHSFTYIRKNGGYGMDISRENCSFYFKLEDAESKQIASADIKLKQAHASSNMVIDYNWNLSNIGYGIEYISGVVTNKLDSKKMWEYLGEDIQYLIPARIDLVLPYDMSLCDNFPDIVNSADFYDLLLYNLEDFLYSGLSKHLPFGQWSNLNAYNIYGNLCSPIKLGLYKNRTDKKGTPIDLLQTDYPTELKDVYVDMNVKYSDYPEYWDDVNNAQASYNVPMFFVDSYIQFNNDCRLLSSPGFIYKSHTIIINDEIGINLSTYNDLYIYKVTTDIQTGDQEPAEKDIIWRTNIDGTGKWKEVIDYLKNTLNINENTIYKKIVIYTEDTKVGDGPIIPIPNLKPLEYIQFVGSDYENAGPNEVTFNDLGIAIMYQSSRMGVKKCHILDKKTGIEYSLTDLGYNENFIWLPKDEISDSSNHHFTSSYMLASDFKNILDRFNILNRKHSSVEVWLEDGSYMVQYLNTNYIFNVIDAKDKDKNDIVKLASQEISLMRTWEFGSGTDIICPYIGELAYPGEVTPEFFEELEKEGWEVNYE